MSRSLAWSLLAPLAALALFIAACSSDATEDPPGDDGGTAADTIAADTFVSSLTLDDLIDACLRASACGIKTYPRLSNCIGAYQDLYMSQGLGPIYDQLYTCVNTAKGDCTAIAKCFGQGGSCDSSYKAKCNGTVAISCDLIAKRVYEVDCADAKLKCGIKTGQTFNASCTPGPCDTSYTDTCKGTMLYSCSSGVIEIRDCAYEGLLCGLGGWKTQTYSCQGDGDRCFTMGKTPFKPYCDGSKAVTCLHSKEHVEDCAKNTYVATKCENGTCITAGTECDSEMNRCAGAKLEACLDGKWKQFDCAALGLGSCKASSTYGANCSKL